MLCAALVAATLAIPHSGVVEGFYGRPWPHEGRIGLLGLMGEVGLNTYVYGPKDDPYHHAKWREPYPLEKANEFRELLAVAKANKIDFYWAVHLGDAFTNDAPAAKAAEYQALFGKMESMYRIGFRAFAAFFDDFGGTNAVLHAEIANRLVSDFLAKKGDCADLIVCPHDYWGDGSGAYCRTLGETCDASVRIVWTGPSICADIPDEAIEKVTENYRRPPFVWYNWPCNDFNRGKLIMGPLYGVGSAPLAGFVVNPMEDLEASKLGICCAAEFARDPAHYDAKAAWKRSIRRLYGEELGAAMEVFCEHNSDSSGGPRSQEGWIASWSRLESERLAADGDLRKALVEIRQAMATLRAKLPAAQPALWDEIKWWIYTQDAQALEGLAALDGNRALYEAARELKSVASLAQKDAATFLAPEWDKKNANPAITGTRVLRPLIEEAAKKAFGGK